MRNKAINIILVIVVGVFLLYNMIPSNGNINDGKTHIRFWYVAGVKDDIPLSVIMFNDIQDSVVVDCTPIPWNEHEKKILTSILSGDPPDVVSLVSTVPKWAARRALVSLDEAIERDKFDTSIFYESLWKEMMYRDQAFALPAYTASFALFYNKTLFKEAGLDPNSPPKTWQDVIDYNKKLTIVEEGKIKQMGFIPHYGNLETSLIMAHELGVNFNPKNDGRTVSISDSAMVEAFNWVLRFFDDHNIEEVNAFQGGFGYASQHGFTAGKVAMMVLPNTFIDQLKKYNPAMDYGVALIPTFENHEPKSSTGSWWYGIPRGASKKNEGWDFIKYIVSKDAQLAESMKREESLFPANKYAAKDSSFLGKHFSMNIFDRQMALTESKAIFPLVHDVFWREFNFARERILHKIELPYQALQKAEKTIQGNLDRAVEYDEYVSKELPYEQFFD